MASEKRVTLIIKPFKCEAVMNALRELPCHDVSVTECRGYGRQKGHLELYSGPEYSIAFVPKVWIEFHASRFDIEAILSKVLPLARTGRIGDGKVFITDVGESAEL